jgi:hypothetical protein
MEKSGRKPIGRTTASTRDGIGRSMTSANDGGSADTPRGTAAAWYSLGLALVTSFCFIASQVLGYSNHQMRVRQIRQGILLPPPPWWVSDAFGTSLGLLLVVGTVGSLVLAIKAASREPRWLGRLVLLLVVLLYLSLLLLPTHI